MTKTTATEWRLDCPKRTALMQEIDVLIRSSLQSATLIGSILASEKNEKST